MRILCTLFLGMLWFNAVYGQTEPSFWRQIAAPEQGQTRWVDPHQGVFFELTFPALVDYLSTTTSVTLRLPDPEGRMRLFQVQWSPAAEPGLYTRFPGMGTFKIFDPTNSSIQGRIDYTIKGFHAQYFIGNKTVMIDPVYRDRTDFYAVYYKDSYWKDGQSPVSFTCQADADAKEFDDVFQEEPGADLRQLAAPQDLYRYRMAIATTGEYSQFHGGTKALVLAELLTAVNRLNSVLERDMGIQLVLIEDNDKIIFLDPLTDGYTNGETSTMIDQNPTRIAQYIPLDDYDIGHVFGVATSGNLGLAQLGCVCGNSKARGVSGLWNPKFDPFYINVVAHEVGHQFAATHSFNSCINEDPGNGWEPGGGSTIMSYSGSCGSNSVQGSAHDYYHGGSLRQMKLFVNNSAGGTCVEKIPTSNVIPEVTTSYPSNFTIPISTPFSLIANGSDENDDVLTYCWEGIDTGPITDAGNPVLTSPLFRSFPAVAENQRYFPRISLVITNTYNKFEHLPHYSREMNFRVTVRDNNPEAGAIIQKDVRFNASELAGPFRVLSYFSVDTVLRGAYSEITWDVAGTDVAPVSCERVNIRMSANGIAPFSYLLAEGVPNTGSYWVTFPKVTSNSARIIVEAADNIFYNISRSPLHIIPSPEPDIMMSVTPFTQTACIPDVVKIRIVLDTLGAGVGPVTLEVVDGLPPGAIATFDQSTIFPPAIVELSVDLANASKGGHYTLSLVARSENDSIWLRPALLNLVRNDFSSLNPTLPLDGSSGISTSPLLQWIAQEDADNYFLEVATSPEFGSSVILQTGSITDTFFQILSTLQSNTLYFWRVIPQNICGQWKEPKVFAFHTLGLNCVDYTNNETLTISSQGTHVVQSIIEVPQMGTASSIWVPRITGNHQNIGQLRGSIRSPSGKTVRLFSGKCFFVGGNIDMGFNDVSQQPFQCPPFLKQIYKSQESLSFLDGEAVEGEWALFIEDIQTGSGGSLTGWSLSLCSDVETANPFIVRNELLVLAPGSSRVITIDELSAEDPDNPPWELTYTLVREPRKGSLRKSGITLGIGDTYTQQDIYDGNLEYEDHSWVEGEDDFLFIIRDGLGGWLPITQFNIRTDASVATEVLENQEHEIVVFPNPAYDVVWVRLSNWSESPQSLSLVNALGQPVVTTQLQGNQEVLSMQIGHLPPGFYWIRVQVKDSVVSKALHIVR